MAYLFISFADRLDRDISTKNELFGDSLRSQFNNLQKRIPLRRQTNNFQRIVMNIMAKELYKTLVTTEDKPDSEEWLIVKYGQYSKSASQIRA